MRWIKKDGSVIWTETRNKPVFDKKKRLIAIEGISRDITQQKISEEKSKDSEERFKILSNATFEGIIFSENGKIIDANGVLREFEISSSLGNICIPIGCTGYASKVIYEKIIYDVENYYKNPKIAKEYLEKLNDTKTPLIAKSKILIDFIKTLTS